MAWVTTKDGRRVNTDWFDKDRQIAENKRQADERNGILRVSHITSNENADSILKSGFDISKAGSGQGSYWGKGVYFTSGNPEKDFYKSIIKNPTSVEAEVDTSKMLKIVLKESNVGSEKAMYQEAVNQFPKKLQHEYAEYVKAHHPTFHTTPKKAIQYVLSKYYTGLIIEQKYGEQVDDISGGNQIVVYDTAVIQKLGKGK